MKLLTKTSLNFITLSVLIFMAGSVLFYIYIRSSINNTLNSELVSYKETFYSKFSESSNLKKLKTYDDIIISKEQNNTTPRHIHLFTDTIIQDRTSGRYFLYRKLLAQRENSAQVYSFAKPLKNADELIANLSMLLVLIFTLFFTGLFLLNRYTMKKSWASFYRTLDKLKNFNLTKGHSVQLKDTDIDEFSELNNVISELTERVANDFENLKEYTENTSHEIQTPLAIISIKVEQLLQTENLTNKQLEQISSIYEAARRLSQMNKSLIYLTKIDRRQFAKKSEISFKELISKNIAFFEDFIDAKEIAVKIDIQVDNIIQINEDLADTLIQNLIKNAIKHNIKKGSINISLIDNSFVISNTSDYTAYNPEDFFKRFKKKNPNSQSPGIGLAIVKKVCVMYNFKISYISKNNLHIITINL